MSVFLKKNTIQLLQINVMLPFRTLGICQLVSSASTTSWGGRENCSRILDEYFNRLNVRSLSFALESSTGKSAFMLIVIIDQSGDLRLIFRTKCCRTEHEKPLASPGRDANSISKKLMSNSRTTDVEYSYTIAHKKKVMYRVLPTTSLCWPHRRFELVGMSCGYCTFSSLKTPSCYHFVTVNFSLADQDSKHLNNRALHEPFNSNHLT